MLNNIVDLSHHNTVTSFQQAKLNGVVGIIHKATQGRTVIDGEYHGRKHRALANGLFWGAHHFGVKGNVEQQAEYFLETINPTDTDLLVLDFEPNGVSGTMTLAEAETFVSSVKDKIDAFWDFIRANLFCAKKWEAMHTILKNCFL